MVVVALAHLAPAPSPTHTSPSGSVRGLRPGSGIPFKRLMEYKNKQGDISSTLAWGDLTDMSLESGKVKEARAKEVGYIWDKRVDDTIP